MQRNASTWTRFGNLLACASLAAAATGCPAAQRPADEKPDPVPDSSVEGAEVNAADGETPAETGGEDAGEDGSAPPPADVSPEAITALGGAINQLGLRLWSKLGDEQKNQCISPASIHVALTMTWSGAKAGTETEMRDVLGLDPVAKAGDVPSTTGALLAQWNADEKITLRTANRLFGEQHYTFEQPFIETAKARFDAPLERLDFANAYEAARVHINDWVAERTEDKIQDLIPPNGLDGNTRLVLTNAIYFLGAWADPFQEAMTKDGTFHAPGGDVQVPMMRATHNYRYFEDDAVQTVALPYDGGRFSMVFVVPREGGSLSEVERGLSVEQVTGWLTPRGLGKPKVTVVVPRFKLAPKGSMELSGPLEALGMSAAFKRGVADFTGMANPPDPADRLHISKVFHKTFVDVNEEGTEAAAATAVVMGRGGGRPEQPKEVRLDRPFLFFLRDDSSGAWLFIGRVVDPS